MMAAQKPAQTSSDAKPDDASSRVPICAGLQDIYGQSSRALIGSLARPFLDQMVLTPTELLYSPRNHLKLDNAGTLLRDITERAADMQARAAGVPRSQRIRELQNLLDLLSNTSRALEEREPVVPLRPGSYREICAQIRQTTDPVGVSTRINRMLTEYLAGSRVWADKLEKVVSLAKEAGASGDLPYIDAVLGEILQSEIAQDAIFGRRISLEDRIDDLVDMYKSNYPSRAKISNPPPAALDLNKLLGALPLPETRQSLETAVVQLLASRNPIRSPELMMELRATHGLLQRLRHAETVIGGRRALEFIDKRMGRLLTGDTIADYIHGASHLSERLVALLEIYAVTFGPTNRKTVEGFLSRYFGDEDFERRFLTGEGSPQHKLKLMTTLYKAVATAPLATRDKAVYAGKLVAMQGNFIASSRLFASVEKQAIGSGRKCVQVLAMCHDGTFIPGDNLERARALIRYYLAKPDFLESYLDGVSSPEGRRELLQDLQKQLTPLRIEMPRLQG
jgi:hypothetical protein